MYWAEQEVHLGFLIRSSRKKHFLANPIYTHTHTHTHTRIWIASLVAQMVKNPPAMQETWIKIPGSGRSPGEKNGNPFQYSCLESSMGRGALWVVQSMGSQRVEHDWVTNTWISCVCVHICMYLCIDISPHVLNRRGKFFFFLIYYLFWLC